MPAKSNAGRPPYKPTDRDKKTVWTMAASGIWQKDIAACIGDGIALKTLRKHFRAELDTAMTEANAKVGATIFEQAMAGNVGAAIWWSKARMGWSERQEIEHKGDIKLVERRIVKADD